MMIVVKTENLKKYYGLEDNIIRAVDGIDLEIQFGEFIAIVGSSGSGKSTLLNLIGGLDTPDSGKIYIDKTDITHMNENELAVFRRRNIGFVFQNYNLIHNLNVIENIILPLELDGNMINYEFIDEILKTLKLESKRYVYPNSLSGGQQQRVAIARALATKPMLILADEPTGNLDSRTSQEVIGLIKMTSKKFNQTVIMITHDENIAQIADRVVRIEDGKIL